MSDINGLRKDIEHKMERAVEVLQTQGKWNDDTVHPEREAVEGRANGSGQTASSVHPEREAPLRQAQGNRFRAIGFIRSS